MWADGTHLPSAPMTGMQWLIWSLAAAGKFFEGFVVFMTGVALPLISREFDIGAAQNGIISAASLFGILVGAVGLGGLSDRFGRKPMFIAEMIIFVRVPGAALLLHQLILLVICLFGIGLALGCDYPTAHMIISESIPSTSRGKLVLGAFAFQAVGALGGTAVGYLVLSTLPDLSAWRWMYRHARSFRPCSSRSAASTSSRAPTGCMRAAKSTRPSRRRQAAGAQAAISERDQARAARRAGRGRHQSKASLRLACSTSANRRATILASVPWFLQDLGTYGIGIFTPTILAAAVGANADHARSVTDLIPNDIMAAKGAALITTLLIVGIIFAVLLADVVGRIWLQVLGFIGCAAGLFLASLSSNFTAARRRC